MTLRVLHRRSIRLPAYDYSQAGIFFVTLCTYNRENLFGDIVQGEMCVNNLGKAVQYEWQRSAQVRQELALDYWVLMPNHLHGIVWLKGKNSNVGAHGRAPLQRQPRSLGSFIAGFKAAATKRVNELRGSSGLPLWQRNYFERVVRNEEELAAIRRYISENPLTWLEDEENLQGAHLFREKNSNVGAHGRAPLLPQEEGGQEVELSSASAVKTRP